MYFLQLSVIFFLFNLPSDENLVIDSYQKRAEDSNKVNLTIHVCMHMPGTPQCSLGLYK